MKTKFTLTVFALIVFNVLTLGQGVKFEFMTLNDALTKAKKENKIIFLHNGESCPWGNLSKDSLKASTVAGKFFNENFINVRPKNKYEIDAIFSITDAPRYFFIKPDGNIVMMVSTHHSPNKLIKFGQKVLAGEIIKPNRSMYTKGMYPRSIETLTMLSYAMQAHLALNFPADVDYTKVDNDLINKLNFSNLKTIESDLNKSFEIGKFYNSLFLKVLVHEFKNEKQKSKELAKKILKKYPHKEFQVSRILAYNFLKQIISN